MALFRLFIKNMISDLDSKKKVAKRLSSPTHSFHPVYSLAEEAKIIRIEVIKLADTKSNKKQFQYYKYIIQKNTSTIYIYSSWNNNIKVYFLNLLSEV